MSVLTHRKLVPYPVIVKASQGDALAMQEVMRRYVGYAAVLSTHDFIGDDGFTRQRVDQDMLMRLEAKLACKILLFDPF